MGTMSKTLDLIALGRGPWPCPATSGPGPVLRPGAPAPISAARLRHAPQSPRRRSAPMAAGSAALDAARGILVLFGGGKA